MVVDVVRADRVEAGVGAQDAVTAIASRSQPIGFRGCRLATSVPTAANGIISSGCPTAPKVSWCASADSGKLATISSAATAPSRSASREPLTHVLTQTLTCAGWREPPAAAASSLRTVSGSTASRRRVPKAATVASAS